MVTDAAEQERQTERQQQVPEQRADDRRAHHLQQAGTQGGHRDDQLREVAESRIEKAADGGSGMDGDLLRSLNDEFRERHDGDRGTEEGDAGRNIAASIEKSGDGREDQEPQERRSEQRSRRVRDPARRRHVRHHRPPPAGSRLIHPSSRRGPRFA